MSLPSISTSGRDHAGYTLMLKLLVKQVLFTRQNAVMLIDHGQVEKSIISPKLLGAKLRSGRLQALELQQFLHQPLEPQEPSQRGFHVREKAISSLFALAKTLYMGLYGSLCMCVYREGIPISTSASMAPLAKIHLLLARYFCSPHLGPMA